MYFTYSEASECSMCKCDAVVLFSDGAIYDVREYYNTEEFPDISIPDNKGHEYWENFIFERVKGNHEYETYRERLVSIDLHSPEFGSYWSKLSKTKRNTNLNLKDLFGTYQLHNCSKNFLGETTPVYKHVLDDGTESYLYKSRNGFYWQVRNYICILFLYLYLIFDISEFQIIFDSNKLYIQF